MSLSEDDYKTQIVAEVGDTPDGFLVGCITRLWGMYEDLAAQPRLRYWYVLKKACETLLGHVRENPDFSTQSDLGVKLNQLFTNLLAMAKQAEDNICLEKKGVAARIPLVGVLTTQAPTVPPPGALDANAPRYGGSPYTPDVKVQW